MPGTPLAACESRKFGTCRALNHRQIDLSKGYSAIVDANDYQFLIAYKWHAHKTRAGTYASTYVNGRGTRRFMHQLILNAPINQEIDHIDGNKLNNIRSNLRIVTRQQNSWNRNKTKNLSTSLFKGVSRCSDRLLWKAKITKSGHQYELGRFKTEIEAAQAYDEAAKKLFGVFAHLNYPTDPAKTGPSADAREIQSSWAGALPLRPFNSLGRPLGRPSPIDPKTRGHRPLQGEI